MLALLLVALALGIDNLAVSLGIGVSGVHGAIRVRVALVFGLFEAGMPLLGMAAGRTLAGDLGSAASWLGGGLLAAVGVYQPDQVRVLEHAGTLASLLHAPDPAALVASLPVPQVVGIARCGFNGPGGAFASPNGLFT